MEALFETTKTYRYCVYCHRNKINGKVYIGQTCKKVDDRWKKGKGYFKNKEFYNDICKFGWDNFDHIIVKQHLSLQGADILEKELITYYMNQNNCYNRRIVGNTNKEHIYVSNITKQKISENVSKAKIGLVWLHRNNSEIQVKPDKVQYYIEQGYTKGRFFDKVWIHNNTKTKMVHKHELQTYLDNGWNKGRFNSSKEAKSMFKKGGDDYE